jgi:hypothetical protein
MAVKRRGGKTMKKMIFGTLLLASISVFPLPTMAEVSINIGIPAPPHIRIGIPMPPHIRFMEPPRLVVVPETYVYVAPDVEEEIFFSDGWWWRPWEGRWYRSRSYDSGWQHYRSTPSFYREVPNNWRNDYRERQWRGQQWNAEPIAHVQVQKNWKTWKSNRHWENNQTWGVQDLRREREPRHPSQRDQHRNSRGNGRDDEQRHGR